MFDAVYARIRQNILYDYKVYKKQCEDKGQNYISETEYVQLHLHSSPFEILRRIDAVFLFEKAIVNE